MINIHGVLDAVVMKKRPGAAEFEVAFKEQVPQLKAMGQPLEVQ